jgi:hypothetical protein
MSTSPIEVIAGAATISAMYFYRGFRSFSERRAVKDNPVSNIVAAAQGFVELQGIAKNGPGGPIISPVSKTPCCAYFIRIIEGSGSNSNTYNRKSLEGFQISDKNSNCCNIKPELAEFITTKMPQSIGYMSSYHKDLSALNCKARPKSVLSSFFYNLVYSTRYEEYILVDGAEVFVSGFFNTKTDSNGKQSNWLDATMPTDLDATAPSTVQSLNSRQMTNKTKKNFIISSVPRSALTKKLSLRTVFYLMVGFGSLLLCVALIIVFQGHYFEVLH